MSKVNGCVIQHSEKILIKSKVGCSFSEISNLKKTTICVDMFIFNSTLNFGIPPAALIFQLEVYYKVDRLLTAQQKGTTARWYK